MARTTQPQTAPEAPFRTSREVYDRLRWDPRFDPRRFVIGYEDRTRGMVEIPLVDFTPGGDIPWHRVWLFRAGTVVMWDRRARIDRVFSDPLALPDRVEWYDDTFFNALKVWRFDDRSNDWSSDVAQTPSDSTIRALRVVTWNVLSDRHDADKTLPERRHPRLIERLGELDADVIVLQEVTHGMLAEVCRAPWVRASYALTDAPPGASLSIQGQLVLSRVPMVRAGVHDFTRHKRAVVCELRVGAHRIVMAAVHLTSDHGRNGPASRAEQMAALVAHLPAPERSVTGTLSSVIIGDFNARDAETFDVAKDFSDAWTTLRPDEPGVTFDPTTNPLAALVSLSGKSARLDRMLLNTPENTLVPTDVERLGTTPDGRAGMFLSDHIGLVFTLRTERPAMGPSADDLATRSPVHTSALVWLPPPDQPPIEAIRDVHDKHRERWMTHVNVLYGFVPDDDFDAAAALIERVAGETPPFTVTLARFERFEHAGSFTVWLRPESHPQGALEALQARLQATFPACTEQSGRSAQGYTAHLTVAQFPRAQATVMREKMHEWQANWQPLRFEVRELCLISRRGDGPFVVRTRVPLGARRSTLGDFLKTHNAHEDPSSGSARAAALDLLREFAPDVGVDAVHPIGSHRMGLARAGSDLDAVALGPSDTARNDYFQALRARLRDAGALDAWRDVPDATAPVVSLTLAGVKVDLQHARFPDGVAACDPRELDAASLDRFDPASRRALQAVLDADAIVNAVRERADLDVFRTVARALKHWAHQRGIDRNAQGFLGGFSWTLLAAWSLCRRPTRSADEALATLFSALCAWRWPDAIALGDAADFSAHPTRDRVPVLAPVGPHRNSARNVTRSTLAVMNAEFERARALCQPALRGAGDWSSLFEKAVPEGSGLRLTVRASDPDALARTVGWVDGQTLALLLNLERDASVTVRPWPAELSEKEPVARVFFALSTASNAPPDAAVVRRACESFRAAFAAWSDRPPDATLLLSDTLAP